MWQMTSMRRDFLSVCLLIDDKITSERGQCNGSMTSASG